MADELDPSTLRYVLETESVASANRLLDRGLDGDRLSMLADKGIDLASHDDGLETILNARKNPSQKGDVGEILAIENGIVQQYAESGETVYPRVNKFGKGIEIKIDGGVENAEFDQLIINDDGEVVRVIEESVGGGSGAKASAKFSGKQDAIEKIEQSNSISVVDNRGGQDVQGLTKGDFEVSAENPDDIVTIVAKGQDDSSSVDSALGPVVEFERTPSCTSAGNVRHCSDARVVLSKTPR